MNGGGGHARSTGLVVLALGALGVVFGDIGTSVLYALKTVFTVNDGAIPLDREAVYGVVSMIIWAFTLVVSVKYVTYVMRADNEGEGGIMALIALIQRLGARAPGLSTATLAALGVFGAALFIGDAMITPAISVLSAVEGLEVISPSLESAILPIALVILAGLFAVQRFGTEAVGRFFGPVCLAWFLALAAGGIAEIADRPGILGSVSPTYAVAFAVEHPGLTFIALSGIVLTITGVEALYADMGHFGRPAIRWSWYLVVFPALALNYMGQGALLLGDRSALANPFYLMYPEWARLPMVLLATAATVIASQAVISGAFSVARQAMQLGFIPRVTIRHTSRAEIGQIYVPAVNWGLLVAVVVLVLGFRSSENLAAAYGIAVTGTLIIDTILFAVVLRSGFRKPVWMVVLLTALFATLDLLFFSASASKILDGGWFPLMIGVTVFTVLMTWDRGRRVVTAARTEEEGPLRAFVETVHAMEPAIFRVPGTAVFLNANPETTPLALRANVEHNRTLHESVVIVSVEFSSVPNVPLSERVSIDDLGYADDGIFHIGLRYGFRDDTDIPAALARAAEQGLENDLDLANASYFLSRITLRRGQDDTMARWRKALFLTIARHAANPVEYFNLPIDRTVIMGGHVTV